MKERRYFLITGVEGEEGWVLEELQEGFFELDEGEIGVNVPLQNTFSPCIYQASTLTQISKESYDKIIELHEESMDTGWGTDEEEQLNKLVKEAIS